MHCDTVFFVMAVVSNKISSVHEERKNIGIKPGDTVRVWTKVEEKGKTRLQAFEGIILAHKHGVEEGATFTVRKISGGVGVEKIFPLYSPNIDKIEILKHAKTRRAKLYYVRDKAAKEIRKKMKATIAEVIEKETVVESEKEEPTTEESEPKEENVETIEAETKEKKEEAKEEK